MCVNLPLKNTITEDMRKITKISIKGNQLWKSFAF